MPSAFAPLDNDAVANLWDIVTVKQLKNFVLDQPEEFLNDYNALRQERDMAINIIQNARANLNNIMERPAQPSTVDTEQYHEKYLREKSLKEQQNRTIQGLQIQL